MDVQMLDLVLHVLYWKYKNQWIQICKHAYDDVQPSEWSRWRSSCCMHFCYYTVFTHSLYCPLRVIKLKYILDTCSIYRFWIWTMDLTYKKLIYFCNLRKFHSRFFLWHFCWDASCQFKIFALKNAWNATKLMPLKILSFMKCVMTWII